MGALEGRVAIVTGAGTGLGRGIAEELAQAGAAIAVAEIDAASGERAAEELATLGVEARAYSDGRVEARRGRRDLRRRASGTSATSTSSSTTPASAGSGRTPRTSPTRTGTTRSRSCRPASSTACAPPAGSCSTQGSGLDRQHLVDPRLLAQPGSDDLLRAEGRRDHDDPGRRGRVGAARRSRERHRARASCARRCGTPTSRAGRSTSSSTSTSCRCTGSALPSEVGKLAVYLSSDDAAYVTGAVLTIDGG